jgi:glycosyltransferase involved in cell wall biosynthesis
MTAPSTTSKPVIQQATDHPLVSFIILTYRQPEFVRSAVQSALDQDYSPLEIIVSDDCSPDHTYDVIAELLSDYRGPHHVTCRRNAQNIGIAGHFAEVLSLTRGELVIASGGDDDSLPERTRVTVEAWLANGRQPDMIACDVIDMDQDGVCHGTVQVADLAHYREIGDWAAAPPRIIGAALAWSRRMITANSKLPEGLTHEDQLGVVRAILGQGGITLRTPLVKYRRGGISRHPQLDTGKALRRKLIFDARNDWLFLSQVLLEAGDRMPPYHAARLHKLAWRARHILNLESAGVIGTVRLTLYSPHADLGFRLRSLMHLRASGLVTWIRQMKTHLRANRNQRGF